MNSNTMLRRPEPSVPRRGAPPRSQGLEVIRLLGLGASSAVWLARVVGSGPHWVADPPKQGTVALKIARDPGDELREPVDPARSAGRGPDLLAEMCALDALAHDHVVSAYGWAETTAGPALIVEAFTAGSLGRLVGARGTLSPGETVTVLTPIARALAHLHSARAAHGDVSPGNVLLAPDGRPALGDLGGTQLLGAVGSTSATEGFTAPERLDASRSGARTGRQTQQATGRSTGRGTSASQQSRRRWEASLTPEADVYSLAAVAWFSLTGTPPGPERRRAPLGTVCPGVPPRLVDLLEEALREAPAGRPTAREFAAGMPRSAAAEPVDLSSSVDDDVVPELPTVHTGLRRGRSRSTRRLLVLGAAGTLLAGGAALGLLSTAAEQAVPQDTSADHQQSSAGSDEHTQRGAGAGDGAGQGAGLGPQVGAAGFQSATAAAAALLRDEDPLVAVEGLAMLRTVALQNPQALGTDAYVAAGAPAEAPEAALLAQTERDGHIYQGSAMEILPTAEAAPVDAPEGGQRASVPAQVTMESWDGREEESQTVRIVLSREQGAWLLYAVEPMGQGS